MRPEMTIHGRAARVFTVKPGDAVGYGATYVATQHETLGLVALGYADGFRRGLSGHAWGSIRGSRSDLAGRISMDQCVVRIPDGMDVAEGEPIVMVGDGGPATGSAPCFDELAALIDTIGYELVSGISPRLPRLYVKNGALAGVSDLAGYRDL